MYIATMVARNRRMSDVTTSTTPRHPAVERKMSEVAKPAEVPVAEIAELALNDKPENGSDSAGNFKDSFKAFSKFGDIKSDGKLITLSQSDKWMKQAKIFENKKITTTDTGIHFKKLKSVKVGYLDYLKFLEDLATTRKVELNEIKTKMANCGAPGVQSVSAGKAAATVSRLTDTTKYTGSHKERFDDSGKGKGIAGRKNLVDGSGYVTGYQHKDTYDNSH